MQKDVLRRLLRCCCCCCCCFFGGGGGGDGGASDEDGWLLSGGFEKVCACAIMPGRARIRSFSHTASLSISICLRHTLLYAFFFLFSTLRVSPNDADVAKIKSPLPYLTPWGQNASIVASLGPFSIQPSRLPLTHSTIPSNGQRFQLFSPHMRPPPNNSPNICFFFFFLYPACCCIKAYATLSIAVMRGRESILRFASTHTHTHTRYP